MLSPWTPSNRLTVFDSSLFSASLVPVHVSVHSLPRHYHWPFDTTFDAVGEEVPTGSFALETAGSVAASSASRAEAEENVMREAFTPTLSGWLPREHERWT